MAAKVLIIHLDLGIGGAENLIVQVATTLQDIGCEVALLTSHHDVNHCFEETKPNGRLGGCIQVYGDWLPRNVLGKFTAFFAILRMLLLAIVAIAWLNTYDMIIIDGVAAPIPLLRLFGHKVIYYCHFPDLLLCTDRSSKMKRLYRFFMDGIEAWATGASSVILVNSDFTKTVFKNEFPGVYSTKEPQVLHPVVNTTELVNRSDTSVLQHVSYLQGYDNIFFSLNRYERKKRIDIAIDAFAHFKSLQGTSEQKSVLVIAGGYDERVDENVQYLQELRAHCKSIGFSQVPGQLDAYRCSDQMGQYDVIFRVSISGAERLALLTVAQALLYTPDREHFGIVPVEAMMQETPVIAVNSGGPMESVHPSAGFLCPQDPKDFGDCMWRLVTEKQDGRPLHEVMGKAARKHAIANFSESVMKNKLQHYVEEVKVSHA